MLTVHPVPAFQDNYLWVIHDGRHAAAVDPGDAVPVQAFLDEKGLALSAILVTHHHGDHIGGLPALAERHRCPVFGPAGENIAGLTTRLKEGDAIEVPGIGAKFTVLDVPGHTAGHIAYVGEGAIFCGDTLFACGCGRLFEGTPAQMHASLDKLKRLPPQTRVYCAHEYTLANIRFAEAVEPGNKALQLRKEQDTYSRKRGKPTVPSTIEVELATNPFLRCTQTEIIYNARRHAGGKLPTEVEVFAAIRDWKNNFQA